MYELFKQYSVVILLFSVLIMSCEHTEHTSIARPIGETFETEVVTHPEWTKHSSIVSLNASTCTLDSIKELIPFVHRLGFNVISISHFIDVDMDSEHDEELLKSNDDRPKILHFDKIEKNIGSMDDMRSLVSKAHSLGVKVLMEWYVGGTSNKHEWMKEHPNYYEKIDSDSKYKRLSFHSDSLQNEMIQVMGNWIDSVSVDGFRVMDSDFAPLGFWAKTRHILKDKKEIAMICDSENPNLHFDSFDATEIKNSPDLWDIFEGNESLSAFEDYYSSSSKRYIKNDYRTYNLTLDFDSSMSGPGMANYFDYLKIKTLLSFTMNGLPLVNSGLALDSLLDFSGTLPDSLNSIPHQLTALTGKLVKLKNDNPALYNGMLAGDFEVISEDNSLLYAFKRTKDENQVITIINFSLLPMAVVFKEEIEEEMYGVIDNKQLDAYTIGNRKLPPFGFEVFVNSKP